MKPDACAMPDMYNLWEWSRSQNEKTVFTVPRATYSISLIFFSTLGSDPSSLLQ